MSSNILEGTEDIEIIFKGDSQRAPTRFSYFDYVVDLNVGRSIIAYAITIGGIS